DMVPTVPGINSVYPNPFNNKCQIRITVPTNEKVSLVLYDILGRKTYTLINKPLTPGVHDFIWEGKNALGQPAASGVYMLNLIQGEYAASRSIQLLK
ncbi:MAG: T9SS type A sorting domain-containing protein, partial [Candidatus Marinimicrobia bacterium]|nr:T9SS type A sorting domain-containing protein [Candidatus Neomarinimicrobiota bacterium]